MVYGGKPSRGCRTCRARRIKCDEGKPTCKRCEKSNRECGGYRPEFEIVHRDQTSSTVRRMRKAAAGAGLKQGQPSRDRPLASVPSSSGGSSPPPVLTVPLAQRASCFFASNFILIPKGSLAATRHGFMEYLVPLIETEPPDSALRYAFNACAFALLGNCAKADAVDLAQLSLKQHTLALAQTHKALGHPAVAGADATLAAVLLLCLYESITAIKESRMLAWRSHIDGAVNIVRTRGREQMCRTKTGMLLFTAVRHHLVSRTLSSVAPLPFGTDWWMSGGDTDSLLAISQLFALRYSELREESSRIIASAHRSPESLAKIRDIAHRARSVDRDIAKWLESIPHELRFRTFGWVREDEAGISEGDSYDDVEAFPGRVDVYPDFVTASAWNIARITRLLIASLSMRLIAWSCAPIDYRTTPEYGTLRRTCEVVISEIIASVPYHFGWHLKQSKPSQPDLAGFACGQEGPGKALPALFLMWSLTCIKNHDISTEQQRAWAKSRLKYIADEVGLKYAHIVNDADIRFPSMMIRRDGLMAMPDQLQEARQSRLTPRAPDNPDGTSPLKQSL